MSTSLPAGMIRPTVDGGRPLRRADDAPVRHTVSLVVPAHNEARSMWPGEIPHVHGFCAFRRSFLTDLDPHAPGFESEAALIDHVLGLGLRAAEVPSLELPRRSGRSHLHAVSEGRRVLRTLIAERPRARRSTPVGVGKR
ncbi:hypothetical protein AB0I10_15965 [Streptomyces sp. NPDC050636]|uniref:hypothetical protein n=1 Tax=Streptomyces sp. NPDC050636 TaxID=3154510 RepID=UPI0034254F3C